MRKLRQFSMAILLTVMLGTSALAGIIDCPPAPAPPPESSSTLAATVVLALVQIAVP